MNNKILHENYLMILNFMYPDEPIKQWVRNDITAVGNYHIDWTNLIEVIVKCEPLKDKSSYHVVGYGTILYKLQKLNIMETYKEVVEFIKLEV